MRQHLGVWGLMPPAGGRRAAPFGAPRAGDVSAASAVAASALTSGDLDAQKDGSQQQPRQKDTHTHPGLDAHTLRDQPDQRRCNDAANAAREIHRRRAEIIAPYRRTPQ